MKRTWPGALAAIACAATISLSAQTPPAGGQTPTTGAQKPPTSASQSDEDVTVTGCLERASGSASSPTGTSGAAGASAGAKFVLKNVTSGSGSPAGTAGTAGTPPSASKATASSYQLDGEDSKLTPHVGHKVQISGTVEKSSSSASAGASGAAKLKVDSVKMIASSCTE
ncbi:MAG: hypothetical protein ACRD1U_11405 [Vicinamibacterales bacterium]